MAHRLGYPTIAFGFLAGEIGMMAQKALAQEDIYYHFIDVPGQTRLNTTVVEGGAKDGTVTSFYGPGPEIDAEHLARLTEMLDFWLLAGRVLVLAGSLARGLPQDIYATFIRAAKEKGVMVILDSDDDQFRLGVEAKPTLIKPNVQEAERLLGRSLPDVPAVLEGARELVSRGIPIVVISMGAAGAVCVEGETAWLAVPPQVERRSSVGSGDSMVAGLAVALAEARAIEEGLRLGTAAGAATAMVSGTSLGSYADVQSLLAKVRIEAM
jgi:1-phosphofructokinase family hexose kinase